MMVLSTLLGLMASVAMVAADSTVYVTVTATASECSLVGAVGTNHPAFIAPSATPYTSYAPSLSYYQPVSTAPYVSSFVTPTAKRFSTETGAITAETRKATGTAVNTPQPPPTTTGAANTNAIAGAAVAAAAMVNVAFVALV